MKHPFVSNYLLVIICILLALLLVKEIGMPNHLFLVAELASIGMTLVRHLVAISSVLAPVIAPVAVVKGKRFRLIGILTGERINQYDSIVMAVASKKEKSLSFLACGNYFYLWVGDFCACS